jgi:hypothetical protein
VSFFVATAAVVGSFSPVLSYTRLDEAQILRTIEDLRSRIGARFPQANLLRVSEQFLEVSKRVVATEYYLRKPIWALRIVAGTAVGALTLLLLLVASFTLRAPAEMSISDVVQTIEAAVNDVVFFGIAVFFLLRIESRVKRRRALEMLHELRSLTHIVDMHQLTKDPALLTSEGQMSPAELGRYLDFCSDMLSLIAKVAALMVQHFNDDVVLAAVNEIEGLTTGLSGKVWQKITILERPSLGA